MRDHLGIPLLRGVPISGDRMRSNPLPPGPKIPPRPFSLKHWQGCLFLSAGLIAAVVLGNAAIRSAVGLSSAQRSGAVSTTPLVIPSFAELLECNAHFNHEILRIKNQLPAQSSEADLPLLHRNYRRLYRILRQVGRRDGIAPAKQTDRLRRRVNQLHIAEPGAGDVNRHQRCLSMAELPIARKRNSQRLIGHLRVSP